MLDKVREDKMNINELLEPNAKKAVFTFGRFNPPTVGHARLMDVVKNAASGADHYVFTGKTNDPKKNPLQYKDKITFLRAMFPHMNIMDDPAIRTPWEALEELGKQYDEVVMVVGSDRKDDFEQQMRPYLKDFGIEKFSIVSSGERDADSNDVSGMSASKARAFARAGDFKSFSQSINGGEKLKQQVYNKVRQGMGITETLDEYAVAQQRPKIAVINNISMRKDDTPFALSYKDTGGASTDGKFYITPQVAKKFMNFYDRQPEDNQALMQKALKTITGTAKLFNQLNLKFDAKLPPDYNDIIEMGNKPKQPKNPEIKSRDPNWRDMEAIRKSGAAGSHKDKKALDKRGYQKHKGKSFDMNEEPKGKPIAYVDMDGVIANFFAEYAKLAGIKSGNYRDIPPAKADPTLDKMIGTDFFDRLPKFPTTDKLIQMVVKEFGSYKILSSPLRGDHENSKEQKIKWIKRELAIQPDEIIVVGRKESYAVQADGTQNILIDDRGKNIEGWLSRGGYGIKYQADEDPLSKVSDGIKDFKEKNNLTEWGGRVVKGINTTVDVGVDAIKKQSAKMGFKVTKDGVPPILAPKNLRSVKRMQEALIKINGSNKDLTLQQQIDLQEIKKGIGKMLKATREVASEVPYQNDGGSMSLLTHPGTKLHQKMRATAKPGTDDWFKTWRTLAYLTKGRKNHYMLPVKEQLEKLLIKHGVIKENTPDERLQRDKERLDFITNYLRDNPQELGRFHKQIKQKEREMKVSQGDLDADDIVPKLNVKITTPEEDHVPLVKTFIKAMIQADGDEDDMINFVNTYGKVSYVDTQKLRQQNKVQSIEDWLGGKGEVSDEFIYSMFNQLFTVKWGSEGPGETAMALLSPTIKRPAGAVGDLIIDGIKVEVKAEVSDGGGRMRDEAKSLGTANVDAIYQKVLAKQPDFKIQGQYDLPPVSRMSVTATRNKISQTGGKLKFPMFMIADEIDQVDPQLADQFVQTMMTQTFVKAQGQYSALFNGWRQKSQAERHYAASHMSWLNYKAELDPKGFEHLLMLNLRSRKSLYFKTDDFSEIRKVFPNLVGSIDFGDSINAGAAQLSLKVK